MRLALPCLVLTLLATFGRADDYDLEARAALALAVPQVPREPRPDPVWEQIIQTWEPYYQVYRVGPATYLPASVAKQASLDMIAARTAAPVWNTTSTWAPYYPSPQVYPASYQQRSAPVYQPVRTASAMYAASVIRNGNGSCSTSR